MGLGKEAFQLVDYGPGPVYLPAPFSLNKVDAIPPICYGDLFAGAHVITEATMLRWTPRRLMDSKSESIFANCSSFERMRGWRLLEYLLTRSFSWDYSVSSSTDEEYVGSFASKVPKKPNIHS